MVLAVPPEIIDRGRSFFDPYVLIEAQDLLKYGKVSVSFQKGNVDSYFVISGIVTHSSSYESKAVQREVDNKLTIKTTCNCPMWDKDRHCPHTASLYLLFHMKEQVDDLDPALPSPFSLGVTPAEYGTIINSPQALAGSSNNSTYSSLQYILHNKKTINFPIIKDFAGTLIIHFDENEDVSFSWKDDTNEEVLQISLFENLYIFDWKHGNCYFQSKELQPLIQKIRHQVLSMDELINSIPRDSKCEIIIEETPLEEVPRLPAHCRIHINKPDKDKLLELAIQFHNDSDIIIPLPRLLSAFTFDGGSLSKFRTKNDAYKFIAAYAESFQRPVNYRKDLSSVPNRSFWIELLDGVEARDEMLLYHKPSKTLYCYSNLLLRRIFHALYLNFGSMLFRFSTFDNSEEQSSYMITPSNLFASLAAFQQELSPLGVSIYYEREELAPWATQIRFERRKSLTSWFNLELLIDDDDLEILNAASIDNGLALTKKGLVLLTPQQKDLLRFMRKYTQYERDHQEHDGKTTRFTLPFNQTRIFELYYLKKLGIDGALSKEEEKICKTLETLKEMPEYPFPEKLESFVRPYQRDGHNWLNFLYQNKLGACLADEMGLGKTFQTLSFIQSIREEVGQVLVICPVSILLNWKNEIEKFSDLTCHVYHGGTRQIPDDKTIILTSYGVMKREYETTFATKHFSILVLDEVQCLKNIRSLGAFAARKINANFRICLTGTPVENDLSEFYNIIDLCVPGIWGDLQFIRTTSNKKTRLLARNTSKPFILRRTKNVVLSDLPPKIEHTSLLSFSPEETHQYKQKMVDIKNRIEASKNKRKFGEVLKGILELRQLCLWQGSGSALSTKMEFLKENLEQIVESGGQAIVFSQFTRYLNIIQKMLADTRWKLARIDGSQSIKKRQEQVDLFQNGDSKIFLISLKAGGLGLNLTAASYVFIMDPWWNPAVENQAIDRAHRIGQQNQLNIYRPIIKNSVEEKVLELQAYKRELFDDLLSTDDNEYFSGKLTMEDFEFLLTDD